MFFGENKKDAQQCTTCSLDVVSKNKNCVENTKTLKNN
jgi:hypothetical protein